MKNSSIILLFNISLKYMGRFFRPILWLTLIVGFSAGLFLFNSQKVGAVGYNQGDVVINEFYIAAPDGVEEWYEFVNTTDLDIQMASWTFHSNYFSFSIKDLANSATTTIPAKGILMGLITRSTENDEGDILQLKDPSDNPIYAVSYGTFAPPLMPHVNAPGSSETAILVGTSTWQISNSPSKGWFNNAVDYTCEQEAGEIPPTLSSIDVCLANQGITSNLGELTNPARAEWLYFTKTDKGKLYFNNILNLTDQTVVSNISLLGEKMELGQGKLSFDSEMAFAMGETGASLEMYNFDTYGYEGMPEIYVYDDSGTKIEEGDPGYPIDTSTIDYVDGTLTFTVEHFTEFDTGPSVVELTPVSTPANTSTPTYVFGTNVTGTYQILGSCATGGPVSTTNGQNTIILGPLDNGTYNDCSLKVVDGVNNSTTIDMGDFTVDIPVPPSAPTINQINGLASTTQYSNDSNLEIYIGGYGTSTPDYIEVYGSSTLLLTYTPTTAPSVATTTLPSEGSWNIYAKSIKDGLTSTASNIYVYNYDATKPEVVTTTVSPNPYTNSDSEITVTVTFSEIMDINEDPVVIIKVGSEIEYTVYKSSFTSNTWIGNTSDLDGIAVDDQTYYIEVRAAMDLAGNQMDNNSTAGSIFVNTIPPSVSFNNDVSAAAVTSDDIEIGIMNGDVDTSTLYYGFKTDNSCDASVSYIYPYGNNIAFTITSSVNNGKYICAKAADIYGNTRYQASTNPLNIVGYAGVNTLEATSLDYTGATLNGEITALGGMNATHRGFYYGTSNPYSNSAITSGSYGLGSFTHALTSLSAGTVYQFIAMASNTAGITTGTTKTFITYFEPSTSTPTSTIDSTYTSTTTVPVPSDVTNAILDMTSLKSGGSVTTPGPVVVNASTSIGLVKLEIPDATTISGTGWDGILVLPTIKENSSVTVTADSGKTASVNTVIEIGFGDTALTFDKAVRILIPGMGGKDAGYYRGTTFYKINNTCSGDTQTVGNALAAGADCKITVGGDLVIWTKHFTKFIAYTQTTIPSSGSGGGTPISRPVLGNVPVTVAGGNTVTSRDITLSFDVAGVAMMAISENSNYTGASWEMYVSPKIFTISEGYGDKTLYIKFRSGSGGETSTSIVVNYTAPTTAVTTVTIEVPTTQTTVADTASFIFTFRAGLTEKQKQSIMNLVESGRLFSQTDARNYAWAVGISDWQQFVGKNPKTIVATGEVVSHYMFTRYLGVGSVGNDVKALQQILKELGYFTYPYVTSYYGSITKEAVVKYQKAKGLAPYPGHVGPATRAALSAE